MLAQLLFVYLLGGVTFLPFVAFIFWVLARINRRSSKPARPRVRTTCPTPDTTSEAEVSGWLRYSPKYVNFKEPGEEDDARKTLQKLASGSVSASKSLGRLQKYWVVVRGGQLQLYENENESQIVDVLALSDFVVMLWPPALQEFELFYRKYPIALVSRSEFPLEEDSRPPLEAFWFYCENPVVKEDIYLGMIRECRAAGAKPDPALGAWDPVVFAQPHCASRSENRELQSRIWTTSAPRSTQWLNALVGRIFLGVKGSTLVERYLHRKFAYELRSISEGSSVISEIQVLNIDCGSSSPFIKGVSLRELTPDGNLVVAVDVEYNGRFRVNLGTQVSLWAAEIPIELAATLASLEGTLIIRIKPPPTSRIWYAFEKMPSLDLLLDPVVYDTQISYGVVTSFIKSRIIESIKETMVMPYMDDVAFYDTSLSNYRGGIWDQAEETQGYSQKAHPILKEPSSTQLGVLQKRTSSVSSTSQPPPPSPPVAALQAGSSSPEYNSTLKKVSRWVRRKTSTQSLRSVPSGSPDKPFDKLDRPLPAPPTVTTQTSRSTARLSPNFAVRRKPVPLREESESPTRRHTKRRPVPGTPGSVDGAVRRQSEIPLSSSSDVPPSPTRSYSTQTIQRQSNYPLSTTTSQKAHQTPQSPRSLYTSQSQFSISDEIPEEAPPLLNTAPAVPQFSEPSVSSAPPLPKPQTVADATSTSVTAPVEPHNWRGSLEDESGILRRTVSRSTGSPASSILSDVPSLPPRRRKYVVLANVAPEPSSEPSP